MLVSTKYILPGGGRLSAFVALGTFEKLKADIELAIETYISQLYEIGSTVENDGDFR